jgi:hypothetical protein
VGTDTDDPVVSAAQIEFSVRPKDSSDVSENTKDAQAIANAWRGAVHTLDPDRFQIEALVTPELEQKIDIVGNGMIERFHRSLKEEENWLNEYR